MDELAVLFDDADTRQLAGAAKAGDRALLKNLVGEGDDPNAVGHRGINLLMWSLHEGDLNATAALLEVGADPNQLDELGDSAMALAATADDATPIALLLKYAGDPTLRTSSDVPLTHLTVERFNWDGLRTLLDAGADIDAVNGFGNTALMLAAMFGEFEQAEWLLDAGANHELGNKSGDTLMSLIERSPVPADSEQGQCLQRIRERITPTDDKP